MSRPIRVLIVDDSALVRRILSEAFSRDPELEVVGTAGDPYIARDKIKALAPDVLTLDIEMPRMDGLAFLRILMQQRPMPVIMVSTLTSAGADAALEALAIGAFDCVEKPTVDVLKGMDERLPDLISKVKAAAASRPRTRYAHTSTPSATPSLPHRSAPGTPSAATPSLPQRSAPGTPSAAMPSLPHKSAPGVPHAATPSLPAKGSLPLRASAEVASSAPPRAVPSAASVPEVEVVVRSVKGSAPGSGTASEPARASLPSARSGLRGRSALPQLLAVGASTGGTEALSLLLAGLPAECPPVVIVQHMPAAFTGAFARRCNGVSPLGVVEAEHGARLQRGWAYIAPGGRHMRVVRDGSALKLTLDDGERINRHRPSVDALFDSVAEVLGPQAWAALLTGMGDDGARGLLRLREAGAFTVAQDRESCVVYGMPREAVRLGAACEVLSVPSLVELVARSFAAR
jgi:two-component system, chemotaxis family, protein-glutamate methylesterase/glutaminase